MKRLLALILLCSTQALAYEEVLESSEYEQPYVLSISYGIARLGTSIVRDEDGLCYKIVRSVVAELPVNLGNGVQFRQPKINTERTRIPCPR